MEAKRYAKIRQAAVSLAAKRGFQSEGDDFAQVAATKIAQGRSATIGQLFIDYLRETYGNPNRLAATKVRQSLAYAEKRAYVEVHAMEASLPDEDTLDLNQDFHNIIQSMEKRERADLILLFKWGFTYKELGELHGVSESQICLDIQASLKRLRKRLQRPGVARREAAVTQG